MDSDPEQENEHEPEDETEQEKSSDFMGKSSLENRENFVRSIKNKIRRREEFAKLRREKKKVILNF